MSQYQKLMDNVFSFVEKYKSISESQIVDFFTNDLWKTCVPSYIQTLYETEEKNNWNENDDLLNHVCIKKFNEYISDFQLDKIFELKELNEKGTDEKDDIIEYKKKVENLQSFKKFHEIERLAKIININLKNDSPMIIDAGAGKGYLSTYISQTCEVPVLAIEQSKEVCHSAVNFQKLLTKKTNQNYHQVKYVMSYISDSINYSDLTKMFYPDFHVKKNLYLIGLHTCGSLVHSMVKSFLTHEDIQTLCVVPCCYHLSDSAFESTYTLSRNQKMLAQQRLNKHMNVNLIHPSLFYRAVLQVILKSADMNDARIGRGLYHEDFTIYARKALAKLGIEKEKIPSDESLQNIFDECKKHLWKFYIFHVLRLLIAPLLEIIIILDISIHLEKQEECKSVEIIRIFDCNISPRSHCILAKKWS